VLFTNDLVDSDNCFFSATAISDGELLEGVRFHSWGATTESLVMRSKSGTRRKITATHRLEKLAEFASIAF
jgi:fructose-1,6-bisphosphatase II